jgi:uncharacterized phage protein (TIGR01671 family)
MNREIKFRAFWKDTKKPVEDFMEEYALGVLDDDCFEIHQCTGLKDKQGKEIYEGDICKISFVLDEVADHIYLLLTDKEKQEQYKLFIVESPLFNGQEELGCDDIEVAGNIFENPELLEGV